MAETLGELVDKLCVANLKLWHIQAWVHEVQECAKEQFIAQKPEDVHEKIRQLGVLNKQRNALMSEIDKRMGQPEAEVIKV